MDLRPKSDGRAARRALPAALLLLPLLSANCAKTGDPRPPTYRVARPAADLAVAQYGARARITLTLPANNTDGTPLGEPPSLEILRIAENRVSGVAALPEAEFLRRSQQLALISGDSLQNRVQGDKLVFHDEPETSDPVGIYQRTFRYAARFINRKNQTAGLSNQAAFSPIPVPDAPSGLTADLAQDRIRLSWSIPQLNTDGSQPPRIAGYNVYRSGNAAQPPGAPLNRDPLPRPEFEDREFQFDQTYYYHVGVVGSLAEPYAESVPSAPLRVDARDAFAPGPPQNLKAVAETGRVVLLWIAPPEPDAAGYRIYRAEEGSTDRVLLEPELIQSLSYRDNKVTSGRKYEYRVTAVDTHGNESLPAVAPVEVP